MKKDYGSILKYLVIILLGLMPILVTAQDEQKKERSTEFTPHWFVNLNAGLNLGHMDVANTKLLPGTSTWRIGYGLRFGYQFIPWLGLRGEVTNGQMYGNKDEVANATNVYYESAMAFGWHLQPVINFSHLFGGYKDRFFNVYGVLGVGGFSYKTTLKGDLGTGSGEEEIYRVIDASTGEITFIPADQTQKDNMEEIQHLWSWPFGLGFTFRLAERWELTLESQWRWLGFDYVDRYDPEQGQGGEAPFVYDVMSYNSLGITYKFGYREGLKRMEKNYDETSFSGEPDPLQERGDSVEITVKGTVPPKYMMKKSGMLVKPFLVFGDETYPVETYTLKGEDVPGDGQAISYQEGGSFSYTTKVPYVPGMNESELMVAPIVYMAKDGTFATEDEIVANTKYIQLGDRKLADGVIYTSKRLAHIEHELLVAHHGYEKETIIKKNARIYFLVNSANLNSRVPMNKNEKCKAKLEGLSEFIAYGWGIKNIEIKGWASPEGEETFNRDLSESRANTAFKYLVREIKKIAGQKESLVEIENPEEEITFDITWHGPNWDGFLAAVEKSDIVDKNAISNVIKSAPQAKREEEIKNMINIYPEIEELLLPPLRRAELYVNCFEPKFTDGEILEFSTSYPDTLKAEELAYAAVLTSENETRLVIYKEYIRFFEDNWLGYNNAGAVEIERGNLEEAAEFLIVADELSPNNGVIKNNLGVLESHLGNYKKAEMYFKEAQQLGENVSYNMGVINITKGDYSQAARDMSDTKCNYNAGLAMLLSEDYAGAENALKCAPQNPETHYLLAIVGARTNNTNLLYENLTKAIEMDGELKAVAAKDREFIEYFDVPDFQAIVQ